MSFRFFAGARLAPGFVAASVFLAASPLSLAAQQRPAADTTKKDTVTALIGMRITATQDKRPAITRLTLPVTVSTTAEATAKQVNIVDVQDAVKYLPSLFVRKRNYGDTQATLATRVWGVSSSARSVIVADGVPLTAYIANNNTIGGPRWGWGGPFRTWRCLAI